MNLDKETRALTTLVQTFRAIFREERDFSKDELDIFNKYLDYTKRITALRKNYSSKLAKVINKQGNLLREKPDKADVENYNKYLVDSEKINQERNKVERGFIKGSQKLFDEFLLFLAESIKGLSSIEIDPEILELVYKPNEDNQYKLSLDPPVNGFSQSPKMILDHLNNFDLFDSHKDEMLRNFVFKIRSTKNTEILLRNPGESVEEKTEIFNRTNKVLSNPKYKIIYLAICSYAVEHNSPTLLGVPVSTIIKRYRPGKRVQYRDRVDVTNCLEAAELMVLRITKQPTDKEITRYKELKNGKVIRVDWIPETKDIPLFTLRPEYRQDFDKETLKPVSRRTISKIWGEIPKDIWNTYYYFSNSLYQLDWNEKDRINLFIEITRLAGQRHNRPNEPIRKKRIEWIHLAGYQATNKTKRSRANELLLETFDKFYKEGIIKRRVEFIPLNDDEIIEVYPNVPKKQKRISSL